MMGSGAANAGSSEGTVGAPGYRFAAQALNVKQSKIAEERPIIVVSLPIGRPQG